MTPEPCVVRPVPHDLKSFEQFRDHAVERIIGPHVDGRWAYTFPNQLTVIVEAGRNNLDGALRFDIVLRSRPYGPDLTWFDDKLFRKKGMPGGQHTKEALAGSLALIKLINPNPS